MGAYKKVRKDGTVAWYYNFSYRGRQYRAIGGTTKTQALRTLERVRTEVINETYQHSREMSIKFNDASSEFLRMSKTNKRSWKRDEQLVGHLDKFFAGKFINQIKPADIEAYKTNRKSERTKRKINGITGSTINRELSALRRIYNIAIKNKIVNYNPVNDVKFMEEPPGRTRYLSQDEISSLLSILEEYIKPTVITALNTGMRLGEILNLTWNCVYLEKTINPYLEIPMTKNNKKRFIELNDVMIDLLSQMKEKRTDSEFVFLGKSNKQIKCVEKPFKRALKAAGIKNFTFHGTRHTFASYFVMRGGDLLSLKEILGHSTMKMVERYAHLAPSHKRKLINNLNFSDKNCHLSVTGDKNASAAL
jgi:integrase